MNVHRWKLSEAYSENYPTEVDLDKQTAFPLSAIFGHTLSLPARGVLTLLCASREREFTVKSLMAFAEENSIRSVRLAVRELEREGIIVRTDTKIRQREA